MTSISKEIEEKLMKLPAIDRACIAEKLFSSLDNSQQQEIDIAWANEAEDRIEAFERSELSANEDTDVSQRIEKKYGI